MDINQVLMKPVLAGRHFLRIASVLSLAIFICFTSFAQKDFTKEADNEFENEGFHKAIELYKKAYAKENSRAKKAEILFKIAECYRLTADPKQSQVWYDKAIKANYPDPIAILNYADAIKAEGKYDEALIQYKLYVEKSPDDPRGKNGVQSCELAQKWIDNPSRFEVQNEVLLNSKSYDFCPSFEDKKFMSLIFSSSREGSTGKNVSGRSGENAADLYYSIRDNKGKWSVPVVLNEPLNSENEEGAAVLNSKKNYIYFTRCHEKEEKSKEMVCQIFGAKKSGQRWEGVELISLATDSVNVGYPAVSDDESIIIFTASNLAGGVGKRDLWYSKYDAKQKIWQSPVNLGAEVNTTGNEMSAYLHDDGSLYFASDGHVGMGQLDIFKAQKLGPEKWGKVENLKSPINSPQNDFGIIFEGKASKGYFSSDRNGGKGEDDIYSFFIPSIAFVIQGTITDVDTKDPIEGATVKLIGTDGSSVELKTDKNGYYNFEAKSGSAKARYVNENTSYQIFVSKEKYLNSKGEETTVGIEKSTIFVHDFAMQNISEPSREIRFPEVLYDLGKWDLRPESKDSLNFLFQVLVDNPTIVIELSAHTDSRSSDEFNQDLSQKRAESCVQYLIEKGIPAERMIPKGYGEKRLLINDKEISKMKSEVEKEAAHQKNRRTVFSVIRSDYVARPK